MTQGLFLGLGVAAVAGLMWAMPAVPKSQFELVKLSCKPGAEPWIEPSCEAPIVPKTMILRFVPPEEFDKEAGGVVGTAGLANPDRSVCMILLPAKGTIHATPAIGYARWDGDAVVLDQILPHEILHCLAGHWHNDPIAFNGYYNLKWHNSEKGREHELTDFAYQPPFMERYGIR